MLVIDQKKELVIANGMRGSFGISNEKDENDFQPFDTVIYMSDIGAVKMGKYKNKEAAKLALILVADAIRKNEEEFTFPTEEGLAKTVADRFNRNK